MRTFRPYESSMSANVPLQEAPAAERLLSHHAALRDIEAVFAGGHPFLDLHVSEMLVKEVAENLLLEFARIDGAEEQVGGASEVRFECRQG